MDLFTMLETLDPDATPDRRKHHLTVWNGEVDPLNVYFEGRFDECQALQRRQNFSRDLVVAPTAMSEADVWLVAGLQQAWHEIKKATTIGPNVASVNSQS